MGANVKDGRMFPFERNRYYAGKLLTSADFQAEQRYMNGKRQFLNRMMFGSGVVCGLSAANLDGLSVIVEAGAAVDGQGREIIVPADVVRKLSSVEGFDGLESENVLLCLRYQEEPVHIVYAAREGGEGEEYEYNRISEGFELYVADEEKLRKRKKQPDFISSHIFLKNNDYTVKISMPAMVCRGKFVKVEVTAEKLSDRDKTLTFEGVLQMPAFLTPEGSRELSFGMRDVRLEQGNVFRKDYWIMAQEEGPRETGLILKKGSARAYVGEYEVMPEKELGLNTEVTGKTPQELVVFWSGRTELTGEEGDAGVCLARLKLLRTESAYMIDSLSEEGERRYVMTPAEEEDRNLFLSYFRESAKGQEENAGPVQEKEAAQIREERGLPAMASGSLEIPLRMDMKKGDVCYSEEIMHGLGKGNVYVDVGVECLENDGRMGKDVKSTIYGAAELFEDRGHMWVQTAVKVYNDKGSFQVAAKLLGEQQSIVLLINWVAVRFVSVEESRLTGKHSNAQICAVTPTARIKPREMYFFDVKYEGMEPCSLTYELTESGAGSISADGVYTAPAREGIYEIRISCADMPDIVTYAYAVVTK